MTQMQPFTWRVALCCLRDCLLAIALALACVVIMASRGRAQACPGVATLKSIEPEQHELTGRDVALYLQALGIIAAQTSELVLWDMGTGVALFGIVNGCVAWRVVVPMEAHKGAAAVLRGRAARY